MTTRSYDYLPKEASLLREDIFVKEQGFVDEFDDIDDISTHLVLFDGELPIATCRYHFDNGKSAYIMGRIAVAKAYRGKNIGAHILKEAEDQIRLSGGRKIYLSAQVRAAGFYEKQGYVTSGEPYYDEYCLHVLMYKQLEGGNE